MPSVRIKFDDVRQFELAFTAAAKNAPPTVVRNVIRQLAFTALQGVIVRSPVDTGLLRGSWFVSTGVPFSSSRKSKDKEGMRTLNKNAAKIEGAYRSNPYQLLFIANSQPYARVVEYGLYPVPKDKKRAAASKVTAQGYSRKSPEGMVRITFFELKSLAFELVNRELFVSLHPQGSAAPSTT